MFAGPSHTVGCLRRSYSRCPGEWWYDAGGGGAIRQEMTWDGRKVVFEVQAKDELETISSGTHARFVVDVAKTVERLKAKAAKRDALKK